MARRKLQLLSLQALLFLFTALEAAGTSNGASSTVRGRSSLSSRQASVFSLDRYGARGDGTHDDTPALKRAWRAACSSPRPAVVLASGGKRYLLKPASFLGPCRSGVTVEVQGALLASPNLADWSGSNRGHWIVFRGVHELTVNGGGAVDGNGDKWWPHSCKINKALVSLRTTFLFIIFFFLILVLLEERTVYVFMI
jgi:polygalacturonase